MQLSRCSGLQFRQNSSGNSQSRLYVVPLCSSLALGMFSATCLWRFLLLSSKTSVIACFRVEADMGWFLFICFTFALLSSECDNLHCYGLVHECEKYVLGCVLPQKLLLTQPPLVILLSKLYIGCLGFDESGLTNQSVGVSLCVTHELNLQERFCVCLIIMDLFASGGLTFCATKGNENTNGGHKKQ
jgi:hypothetical protein